MEILAENISKIINGNTILKDINLHVKSGQVFSLIGKNGAGKTTLFRLILNLYNLTSGKLLVNNVDVNSSHYVKVRNEIGFLLDNIGLFRELSTWDNMEFFYRIYFPNSTSRDRTERITKLLKEVDLYQRKDDKITFFSRGMKQRLALARAVINDPKLLILDEPNRGLDLEGKDILRRYIKEMRKNNSTVFINSHDLNELQEICSHFAFINEGSIIYSGTYQQIQTTFAENTYSLHAANRGDWINALGKEDFVQSINTIEDHIIISLKDDIKNLSLWLNEKGIEILELKKINNNLEYIYNKLIGVGSSNHE